MDSNGVSLSPNAAQRLPRRSNYVVREVVPEGWRQSTPASGAHTGNDTITGNESTNRLAGGEGSDTLSAGAGDDTYVFAPRSGPENDTIVELVGEGLDTLDFSALDVGVSIDLTSDTLENDLSTGSVNQVATSGQSLNFEIVIGTEHDDKFTSHGSGELRGGESLLSASNRR